MIRFLLRRRQARRAADRALIEFHAANAAQARADRQALAALTAAVSR